jgi:hypothetical protein
MRTNRIAAAAAGLALLTDGIVRLMKNLGLEGSDGFQQYLYYLAIREGAIELLPIPQGGTNFSFQVPRGTEPVTP